MKRFLLALWIAAVALLAGALPSFAADTDVVLPADAIDASAVVTTATQAIWTPYALVIGFLIAIAIVGFIVSCLIGGRGGRAHT